MAQQTFATPEDTQIKSKILQLPEEILVKVLRKLLKSDGPLCGYAESRIIAHNNDPPVTDADTEYSAQLLATCQLLFRRGRAILYDENTLSIYLVFSIQRFGRRPMSTKVYGYSRATRSEPVQIDTGSNCCILDHILWLKVCSTRHLDNHDGLSWVPTSDNRPIVDHVLDVAQKFRCYTIFLDNVAWQFTAIMCALFRDVFVGKLVQIRFDKHTMAHHELLEPQHKILRGWIRCNQILFPDFRRRNIDTEETKKIVGIGTRLVNVTPIWQSLYGVKYGDRPERGFIAWLTKLGSSPLVCYANDMQGLLDMAREFATEVCSQSGLIEGLAAVERSRVAEMGTRPGWQGLFVYYVYPKRRLVCRIKPGWAINFCANRERANFIEMRKRVPEFMEKLEAIGAGSEDASCFKNPKFVRVLWNVTARRVRRSDNPVVKWLTIS